MRDSSVGASVCTCEHVGDVPADPTGKPVLPNTHGGLIGHGPCQLCDCQKFTWERRLTHADVAMGRRRRL